MAELASPESWCTGNGTVGSNPTPSAAWGVPLRSSFMALPVLAFRRRERAEAVGTQKLTSAADPTSLGERSRVGK